MKYFAKKVRNEHGEFDSKAEYERYLYLKHLEDIGDISFLKRQVKFELIPKQKGERPCHYIADFTYMENGELVVEDVKGVRTEVYKIKQKLMLWVHGIRIKET